MKNINLNRIIRFGAINKEKIKAVHDDDLEKFLGDIGMLRNLSKGKIHCKFCGDIINLDSLQAIFPDSGTINVICNKKICIRKFLDYSERIK